MRGVQCEIKGKYFKILNKGKIVKSSGCMEVQKKALRWCRENLAFDMSLF